MPYEIPPIKVAPEWTVQEVVYARLRHAIMVGAIPPGTPLTMRGLAQSLDVSPTPIREALRRLTSESAILAKNNRRMMIPHMTTARFEDLVETRITLECHAARRALPYMSDVIIGQLREIDIQMDAALLAEDYDLLTVLNHEFHDGLFRANPEHSSAPLIESLCLQLGPQQRQGITAVAEFYKVDRHKEILNALDARDEQHLVDAIRQDIRDGAIWADHCAGGSAFSHS